MNIVITGANRGLGLGLVAHYLAQGHELWACARNPCEVTAWDALASSSLHPVRWDVADDAPPQCMGSCTWPSAIHVLINNAGIYGPVGTGQSLQNVSSKCMLDVFNVDAIGPLRVVQHLLPALREGDATVANIASKMGSISDNSSGGNYAYRAAKTALMMVSKSMAVDLADSGIHVITLHPGWVKTDMTDHHGLINVATSVQGMSNVISRACDYLPGDFIAFDGTLIGF
ncbi:MAG: SDR family oxidoreductase [Mariprofundaceae bacterium]|nr:SDR family oxidoreductase [Mariprofundaceae bacterium]